MIFKNFKIALLTFLFSAISYAKPLVVTTLPEFAYLISEIAKDQVEVKSLLVGIENPHFLDVRPDFISMLRKASLICFSGLELEVGWLPKSIEKAANPKIRPNTQGSCDLGSQINPIDKINTPIDRSMGDVHAAGNPHYNLSLKQIRLTLNFLTQKLAELVPQQKSFFESNKQTLDNKLKHLDEQITLKFELLKQRNKGSVKVSQYHKEFSYLIKDYSLTEQVSIEEKPGISPSAGRVQKVALQIKTEQVDLMVAADDAPVATLEKLKESSGVPYVILPRGFNIEKNINSFDKLYSEILKSFSSTLTK
jgi:zinc/manganese transport system substrate-binding protein